MTTLNVTYNGESADYPLETATDLSDDDIKRVAAEIVRVPPTTFELYVVDRIERRVYLRPKVPFGVDPRVRAWATECLEGQPTDTEAEQVAVLREAIQQKSYASDLLVGKVPTFSREELLSFEAFDAFMMSSKEPLRF